jgi:hypothetical protein
MWRARRRGAGRGFVKALLIVMLLAIGAAAGAYHFFLSPEARHERQALRLIRTLRMDESDLVVFVRVFDSSLAKGRITRQQHDCIVAVTRADIARMQTRGVSAYLNERELKQASAYFESVAGQKILRYLHWEMKKLDPDYPVEESGEQPEFDLDDMEQIANFGRTPTGAKVRDIASVMEQTSEDMAAFIRNRKVECGAAPT